MFSVEQKRSISSKIQEVLKATGHPELPPGDEEIRFQIRVEGAEVWSWAVIKNNGAVKSPSVNPWNEGQAARTAKTPQGEKP